LDRLVRLETMESMDDLDSSVLTETKVVMDSFSNHWKLPRPASYAHQDHLDQLESLDQMDLRDQREKRQPTEPPASWANREWKAMLDHQDDQELEDHQDRWDQREWSRLFEAQRPPEERREQQARMEKRANRAGEAELLTVHSVLMEIKGTLDHKAAVVSRVPMDHQVSQARTEAAITAPSRVCRQATRRVSMQSMWFFGDHRNNRAIYFRKQMW
jgi:hypothetical protein